MTPRPPDTDELVLRSARGDDAARQALLVRHRGRLRQMIGVRLDRRLLGRLDPSDVVQEVLLEAHEKLNDYLRDQPLPFYPWLRQIAWQRLVKIHQHYYLPAAFFPRRRAQSVPRRRLFLWRRNDLSA